MAKAGVVDDGEFAGSEVEGDNLKGAGGEMNALETGKRADGGAVDAGVGDVEFDDFVAGEGGVVGDAYGNLYRRIAREGVPA